MVVWQNNLDDILGPSHNTRLSKGLKKRLIPAKYAKGGFYSWLRLTPLELQNEVTSTMVPIHKVVWHETWCRVPSRRTPEPLESMDDLEQVRSYVDAYRWGGPTSGLMLYHLEQLSRMLRPGDRVLDLACGHGPILLELAPLYPDVTFIGVDVSQTMLYQLRRAAQAKGLSNIEILEADIRALPGIALHSADVVISTSALHHLRDDQGLACVFERIASVLKSDGGIYLFDFGLLKSREARRLMVEQVAVATTELTARDYEASLDAAFPMTFVQQTARRCLPAPFRFSRSLMADFFYFIQSEPRASPPASVQRYLRGLRRQLTWKVMVEYYLLTCLQARSIYAPRPQAKVHAAVSGERSSVRSTASQRA